MIERNSANVLLDIYGKLLSPRQKQVLEYYYQDDLSLTEIAENLAISRAAVYDALSKGNAALEHFEGVLHLREKSEALIALANKYPVLRSEIDAVLFDPDENEE